MSVIANTTNEVIFLDILFQKVIRIIRIPFIGPHFRHEIHPSSCKSIIGINVYRMNIHQAAKVISPCIKSVERTIGMVRYDIPQIFRRNYPSIVIFVQKSFLFNLFLSLSEFPHTQIRYFLLVILHFLLLFKLYLISISFSFCNCPFFKKAELLKGFFIPKFSNLTNPNE